MRKCSTVILSQGTELSLNRLATSSRTWTVNLSLCSVWKEKSRLGWFPTGWSSCAVSVSMVTEWTYWRGGGLPVQFAGELVSVIFAIRAFADFNSLCWYTPIQIILRLRRQPRRKNDFVKRVRVRKKNTYHRINQTQRLIAEPPKVLHLSAP